MQRQTDNKVTVVVRKQPLDGQPGADVGILETNSSQQIAFITPKNEKEFSFDRVFDSNSSQFDIYKYVMLPIMDRTFVGVNSLVFLYGPRGSGKSYSIIGKWLKSPCNFHKDAIGLLPRTIMHLLAYIKNEALPHKVAVSFIEVFNGKARDLLGTVTNEWGQLYRRELTNMEHLVNLEVENFDEFRKGLNNALIDQQRASDIRRASEVHTIYKVALSQKEGENANNRQFGNIVFVHLAGSQHVTVSGGEITGPKKGLFALAKVIKALNTNANNVPYDGSKLTTILKNDLFSTSHVVFLATVAECCDKHILESEFTLEFADIMQLLKSENVPLEEELHLDPFIELRFIDMEITRMCNRISKSVGMLPRNYRALEESTVCSVMCVYNKLITLQDICIPIKNQLHIKTIEVVTGGDNSEIESIEEKDRIMKVILAAIIDWKKRVKLIAGLYGITFPPADPLVPEQSEQYMIVEEVDSAARARPTPTPSSIDTNVRRGTRWTSSSRQFQGRKTRIGRAGKKNENWKIRVEDVKEKFGGDNQVFGNFLQNFVSHLLQSNKINMRDVNKFNHGYKSQPSENAQRLQKTLSLLTEASDSVMDVLRLY